MESLFLIICFATVLCMPFFTSWISKLRTAILVSRIYCIAACALFTASIALFITMGESSSSLYDLCAVCEGSSIALNGAQCAVCQGAGEAIASYAAGSVPWLYPMGMIVLGIYIAIFSFALKQLAARSGTGRQDIRNR